ncbi:MAG TPA: 30S ribosomal protein S16 [Lentisphaeria bacterium]|nr:MAG: 30S ribosomal protein S16 [Lentisphaerae bacterium GWF2_38_69]HBM14998.1 30S ribosomal protein S16 [Lentisphaeria bacterium]
MAVKIRLKRTGGKNKPAYRVIVADVRKQRDGKVIETLGFYDPRHQNEKIDVERIDYWISKGAQPSETVNDIVLRTKGIQKPKKVYSPKKEKVEAK